MPKQYTGLGLSLLYPDSWTISEETQGDRRQGVSLENPGGSFMSINLLDPGQEADAVLDEAVEAMNAEYEDIESEPYALDIDTLHIDGTIQRFYYLDFVIVSKLFAINTHERLYLVQIQGEDRDMDQQSLVFEAILTSMVRSLSAQSE
jgi:hypothetical protein